MKIYNEIVFDMNPESSSYEQVLYEESFEYSGDLMLLHEIDAPHVHLDGNLTDLQEREVNVIPPVGWEVSYGAYTLQDFSNQLQDIQARPSTPLPSLSNMGVNAFTGVVNWNAIPSGFQPLPQVVGEKKKLYQLSQFHGGINQKSSPRDISDLECQEAVNVTFSSIGAIKLLGDIQSTDNSVTTNAIGTTDRGASGYGLFQFTAPADQDGTAGEEVITLSADGDRIDAYSEGGGNDDGFIDYAGNDNHDVAHIIYAAGNGVYACDANFGNTSNSRKAKIYVYREDEGNTVSGWKEGLPLINSPTYHSAADASMNDGTVKCTHDGGTADKTNAPGTMIVECDPTGTAGAGDGDWGIDGAATYYFYASWLFDGGVETGLTSFADDGGDGQASNGIAFNKQQLNFNISLAHTPHASNNTELGGDKRIEGGRIYFKEVGATERYLLAEFNLIDGVKGAVDSTFSPWTESSDVYSHTTITFDSPPTVYTYSASNGYYANEVYTPSTDSIASTTAGPTAIPLKYKTSVVGQQGVVFIGNVLHDGRHLPDMMMFSMPNKPGVFPKLNYFDSPSSDGSPITALAAFQDTILQFKQNAMYVINISDPGLIYAEAVFRDCGVHNPCQVFTTSFGVIFANKHGCFIYEGKQVISLTGGRFNDANWDLPEDEGSSIGDDGAGVPCVGYDPRSQSIIVLKDVNDDSTDESAWVFNMITSSWTEGNDMITNADGNRHSNFIITSGGYLSMFRDDSTSVFNYNQGATATQAITYWTKDLDFGFPSQTKKLFKVYITYKGDADALTCAYGIDGETDTSDLYHFSTASVGGTTDTTPLSDVDDGSGESYEKWTTTTLYPDDADESKGWKSISLYFNGTVDDTFEIQDISILYRLRPIK